MRDLEKPIPAPTLDVLLPPNRDYTYFENWRSHPFRHDASAFELVNAWWLAETALLAYGDEAFIRERVQRAGLEEIGLEIKFLSGGNAECWIAHNREFVIVAFRGTQVRRQSGANGFRDIFADFFTDANCILVQSDRWGRVHRGFKRALDRIWSPTDRQFSLKTLLDRVMGDKEPKPALWFTGHSSGGALATLAAYRYGHVRGIYTFGAPRPGDGSFAADFTTHVYRVVNNNDFITRLPPFGWYEHVGVMKYIDSHGALREPPGTIERLDESFRGTIQHLLEVGKILKSGSIKAIPLDSIADHAPLYYTLHIWNNYVRDR